MEDELTCPVCHKHFKNKISLKKHKARQHSEKGPVVYHCEFCEISCRRKYDLKKHVEKKHGNIQQPTRICETDQPRIEQPMNIDEPVDLTVSRQQIDQNQEPLDLSGNRQQKDQNQERLDLSNNYQQIDQNQEPLDLSNKCQQIDENQELDASKACTFKCIDCNRTFKNYCIYVRHRKIHTQQIGQGDIDIRTRGYWKMKMGW